MATGALSRIGTCFHATSWNPCRLDARQAATKLQRLEENTGAAVVELSPEELKQIEAIVKSTPARGARYSADRQKLVGR